VARAPLSLLRPFERDRFSFTTFLRARHLYRHLGEVPVAVEVAFELPLLGR